MKTEKVEVLTFINGPLQENCYLAYVAGSKAGVLIDPGSSFDELKSGVGKSGVRPVLILATHGHFDHVGAVQPLKDQYQAGFACHEADLGAIEMLEQLSANFGFGQARVPGVDRFLGPDEEFEAAGIPIKALHTPGHTPGGMCYYLPGQGILFSGDTLFEGTVGRTDLPGGSARDLTRSVKTVLYKLPDETIVYPGHGDSTTIGREKKTNPFMRG
jgi:hydroxyacylglutathione hydrolase